jgi:hypothetical protein
MAVPVLEDVEHTWGGDIALSPTGDLGRVSGARRSEQRVLRRLMTVQGEYLWEPNYGGGLPARIGQTLSLPEIKTAISGQMRLEDAVSKAPPPVVNVRAITGGVAAAVQYTSLPDKQPVSLAFDLNAAAE